MDIEVWKKKQREKHFSYYSHFDFHVSLDQCWDEISSESEVKKHDFFPFIHYVGKNRKVKWNKQTKKAKQCKPKERQIYYAAHKDSWIYRYYAYLLNEKYNERAVADGIDSVSVAYRNNHPGKNNVDYALEAFRFIQKQESCYVMIGDFTDFFDNLEHRYLKKRICDLLQTKDLRDDYYAVFKNITNYSYVELSELLKYHNLSDDKVGRNELNALEQVMSPKQLRDHKEWIKKNPKWEERRGVPQGSPISAVLANIYMLETDKKIADYVRDVNGFYMRYSDDFIAIIPNVTLKEFRNHDAWIRNTLDEAGKIELKKEKTKAFHFENHCVRNCVSLLYEGQENGKDLIEFLGLSFDGKNIRLRDKTISRFYNKMYRKVRSISSCAGVTKKGNRISNERLYKLYSIKGSSFYRKRENKNEDYRDMNFLDYVHTSQIKCNTGFIDTVTPRHMQKIKAALKKEKNKTQNRSDI